MKKKLALIILLALALTTLLASCSQPDKTPIIPRWSENANEEIYQYTISLADFAESGNTRFAAHAHNDVAYYKDFAISIGEAMDSLDEIRPTAIDGTYSIAITYDKSTDCNTVVTSMEMHVTYEYKDGKIKIGNEQWLELIPELRNPESDFVNIDTAANTITLTSTTDTMVEFKYKEKQAPQKSGTTVDGFYIGKTHQEKSSYEISTVYQYEGKNAVAKVTLSLNGGQATTEEYTLKRYAEGSFIDSNQLFLYARSFDKTSSSFADNPTVAVYNPMNHEMQSASFAFTASANAMLTNGSDHVYAKVPTLGVSVNGNPFMLQIAAPNMVKDKNDRAQYQATWYAKHTPLRFRVGYVSFELNYQVGAPQSQSLWNALNSYVNSADEKK